MAWKSVAINGTLANFQHLGRLQSPISQTLLAKSGTSTKRLLVKATRWWNHCRKQHKHRFSPNLMDKPNVCCSLCMSLAHQHLFWLLRSPKASSQHLVSWCHVPISSFSWIIWSLSGRVSHLESSVPVIGQRPTIQIGKHSAKNDVYDSHKGGSSSQATYQSCRLIYLHTSHISNKNCNDGGNKTMKEWEKLSVLLWVYAYYCLFIYVFAPHWSKVISLEVVWKLDPSTHQIHL